eukprot:TRINITY_DN59694_c0_g1_i1.p1 TRINITY_DN59694_c0_g1~~TRINITY_DN59694_c0_g1_i1.p1  ORF type:complete len:324 (-),score=25.87 TRINITY_DN59694_c0_g1_i1:51-992(-)
MEAYAENTCMHSPNTTRAARHVSCLGVVVWHIMGSLVLLVLAAEAIGPETGAIVRRLQSRSDHDDHRDKDDYHDDLDHQARVHGNTFPFYLIGPVGMFAFVSVGITSTLLYWCCFIRASADKFLPRHAVVPDDLKGRWKHKHLDFAGACGTCLAFTFCGPCAHADLWYRVGWLHLVASLPSQDYTTGGCAGWPWFVACGGATFLSDAMGCFFPCFLALLTGGVPDSQTGNMGEIVPMRRLFGLPRSGCDTFCNDCCCWCWCPCLQGTVEYRQVMDVLNRGPVQVAPPIGPGASVMVVGQPVGVQGAPQAKVGV